MRKNARGRLTRQVVSSIGKVEDKHDIFNTTKGKLYQIPLTNKAKKDRIKANMISLIKIPDAKEGACQNEAAQFNSFY